jgi:S-adenosylmethionine synthetase
VAEPTSIYVELDGKHAALAERLETVLPKLMNLTPYGIRDHLALNQAIYARTAAYGHFGRTPDSDGGFSWEKTDLADKIKAAV